MSTRIREYKAKAINRTAQTKTCYECGDVIEPGDYYFVRTAIYPFSFMPKEQDIICVGCHEIDKEILK